MRLVPYAGPQSLTGLAVAPGWPHDDTADALAYAGTEGGARTWLVLDDDDRVAGECGIKAAPDGRGRVEIGYGLAAPSRGRGLGGRVVAALLDELAASPEVRSVVAEVAVANDPSRRLLERLGFQVTGEHSGYVAYELPLGR